MKLNLRTESTKDHAGNQSNKKRRQQNKNEREIEWKELNHLSYAGGHLIPPVLLLHEEHSSPHGATDDKLNRGHTLQYQT